MATPETLKLGVENVLSRLLFWVVVGNLGQSDEAGKIQPGEPGHFEV